MHERVSVLGMYDFPELRPAWDMLYQRAARDVDGAPATLAWDIGAHDSWLHPDLALGMACGWPLVKTLGDQVRVVGTFSYSGADGPPHMYRSVIVTASDLTFDQIAESPERHRAALNSTDSLSGNISLLGAFGLGLHWPGEVVFTGSHVASIEAVRTGAADVAAIDGMTWRFREREAPETLAGLRIIGHGPLVPCLPLIVPAATPAAEIDTWRDGFAEAVRDASVAASLGQLMVDGFVPLDAGNYTAALAALIDRHLQPA